jgi:hypothetical protein
VTYTTPRTAGPSPLSGLAQQWGGPLAMPYISEDQYLAEALDQIAQSSQSLKSPTAFYGNLAADAIDQFGRALNNRKLLKMVQQGMGAQQGNTLAGTGLPGDPLAPGAAAGQAPGPGAPVPGAAIGGAAAPGAAPGGISAPAGATPPPGALPGGASNLGQPSPDAMALAAALQQGSGTGGSAPQASPQALELADALSPHDLDAAVRTAYAEDPQHAGAIAGVIRNRESETGEGPAALVSAPHQFPGYFTGRAQNLDPTSPAYQRMLAEVAPILAGSAPNPAGSADHYFNPSLADPSWGRGPGEMIGQQKYLTLNDLHPPGGAQSPGASAFGQSNEPSGQPSTATASQQPPTARPVQLATGPDPSMPSPGAAGPTAASPFAVRPDASAGAASANGASPSPQPGAGGASTGAQGVPQPQPYAPPTGGPGATPQEVAIYNRLIKSPIGSPGWTQAMQLAQSIQQRVATIPKVTFTRQNDAGQVEGFDEYGRPLGVVSPAGMIETAGPRIVTDGQGGFRPAPGTSPQPLTDPAERARWGIAGNDRNVYALGPNGPVKIADGAYQPLPSQARAAAGISPDDHATYAVGPDGKPVQVAPAPFAMGDVITLRNNTLGGEQYRNYVTSNAAWKSMVANAGKPNGLSGYAMKDTFARIVNPGAVARVGTIQAINDSTGIPESLKSQVLNLAGDGNVSPELAQQIMDATLPFAQANDQALRSINQANGDLVKRKGYDPQDVTVPMDPAPTRVVVGGAQAGLVAQAKAALAAGAPRAAVLQRLQSMGVDPSGL